MTSPWLRDYEIISQLRAGGMATLCLAQRHGAAGFARLVALRLIRPNLVGRAGFLPTSVQGGLAPLTTAVDGYIDCERSGS